MTTELARQLQPYYQDFKVHERLLLSGHSHQAWPDVAKQGILECYQHAAEHIDDKWQFAFQKAERVKAFYASLLGEPSAQITLGSSTHELILRFLSDLDCFKPPNKKPIRIVTTDGEFHSMRRQLNRLKDLNIDIQTLPVHPTHTLAQRLIEAVDANTDAVMVSAVFYGTSEIFEDIGHVADHAYSKGVPCLVDAYHALNVIPFNIKSRQLEHAFIVSGGYKYCQAGEGNCMLRIPENYQGSPIITGWFAEFNVLEQAPGEVKYAKGSNAFSGSTYDPVSHYRAAAVFDFFESQRLTPEKLRDISQQQITFLSDGIKSQPKLSQHFTFASHSIARNAGFLALTTKNANQWATQLNTHGVQCDSRGQQLRLGPAPYVSFAQLNQAITIMDKISLSMK
ncbi:kynureninase [Pseudoalteromonas citrea]|uniref:Kynureninase n=2 Tax=Pseudoalteromonas citrea TaxID=43655 RepID=A0A5S3XPA4_9GAMM|nr:kynureninase [Pseudoalteromonas citrea]TMP57085.1 kynureninase [Pseudoalteromonas citrea]